MMEKKWYEREVPAWVVAVVLVIAIAIPAWAAVGEGVLINGQDYSTSSTVEAPLRIGAGADNSTNAGAKLAVLSARANAANPTWTEGNMVPLHTDLAGNLATTGTGCSNCTVTQSSANTGPNAWPVTPYQGATLLNVTATSGATSAQTLTCTGAASQRVTIRSVHAYASATTTGTLVIQDGGVTKVDFGTLQYTTQSRDITGLVVTGATANNLTVVAGATAAGTSTISVVCDRM